MTDDSLGADSGAATESVEPATHDGAFYDTSVLLDYALGQDDGAAADCLDDHRCENVTGETPRREFDGVVERRERVVKSLLAADGLDDWTLPESVDLTPNDEKWLQELLGELQALADEGEIGAELIDRRDRLVRGRERLFAEPERLIDHVAPNELDAQLVARLRGDGVSDNEDRHVVSEAAHWAVGADGDALVTADENHMLSNQTEIATTVARNRSLDSLTVCRPSSFSRRTRRAPEGSLGHAGREVRLRFVAHTSHSANTAPHFQLRSRRPSGVDDILAEIGGDAAGLVCGAAALDLPGLRSPAHVLARATRGFFRAHDRVREAAAVQRHCAGAATDADLLRLARRYDPAAVTELRATYADDAGPTTAPQVSLAPVARVDADATALAVGTASLRWDAARDGDVTVTTVLDRAVTWFFDAHEPVRHAAAARRYADTETMTRGTAARLADVPRGEIRGLLRDHGVTPWKGGAEGGEEG